MIRALQPGRRLYTVQVALVVLGVPGAAPVIALAIVRFGIPAWLPIVAAVGTAGLLLFGRSQTPIQSGILVMAVAAQTLGFFTLPTGRESRLVISLVIALGLLAYWFLTMLLVNKRLTLKPSPVNRPLLAFVAVNLISYVWSLVMRDEMLFVWPSFPFVQVAALLVNVTLPLVLLLAANHYDDEVWARRLVTVFLALAFVATALYLVAPSAHTIFFGRGTRGVWPMWSTVFAYALALFGGKLKPWQRAALLLYVAVQVYVYFFDGRGWVSGWLPLGVACAIVTFVRSRRLFLLAMVAGLLLVALNFNSLYETTVVAQEAEGSGSGRVALWVNNLNHVRNHPLFGMGPAGYAPYNMTYHPSDARSTHNNYFDLLAQTGIVGALVFVWLALTLVGMAFKTWRAVAGQRNFLESFTAAVFAGAIGALVSMMLGDWVLPFAYNQTVSGFDNAVLTWLFLGCMAALHGRLVMKQGESAPAVDSVGVR